jgi:hypothetical protein
MRGAIRYSHSNYTASKYKTNGRYETETPCNKQAVSKLKFMRTQQVYFSVLGGAAISRCVEARFTSASMVTDAAACFSAS